MFQANGTTTGFDQINNNISSSSASAAAAATAALEMELQHQLEMEQCYDSSSNWQHHEIMGQGQGHYPNNYHNQIYAAATVSHNAPAASLLASLGLLAADHVTPSAHTSPPSNGVVYDPLNFFHPLPNAAVFTLAASGNDGGFFTVDNGDGAFEFTATESVKDSKSEKHRRLQMKDKYELLKSLVPNPSKNFVNKKDRASIVADAIVYINELKRTVTELKGLVERKRCARERLKRPKIEESEIKCEVGEMMDGSSSSLRSSWLHRKTKNTEVDVRIIDDEVTVKLVQQKRINCLLFVSKVLDELHLDLHHVAGGLIGDYYSYLFNSKIGEGSMVYASAVADKLIEVVDKQYAAVSPATNY